VIAGTAMGQKLLHCSRNSHLTGGQDQELKRGVQLIKILKFFISQSMMSRKPESYQESKNLRQN